MTTILNLTRDCNGYPAYGLKFADNVEKVQLQQNAAQQFTVPGSTLSNSVYAARWLLVFTFDPGLRIFVARNKAATVPGTTIASDSQIAFNPTAREAIGGDTISLITPDTTAYVMVELYALQS